MMGGFELLNLDLDFGNAAAFFVVPQQVPTQLKSSNIPNAGHSENNFLAYRSI